MLNYDSVLLHARYIFHAYDACGSFYSLLIETYTQVLMDFVCFQSIDSMKHELNDAQCRKRKDTAHENSVPCP
jgi:hypothetical protein